MQKRKRVWIPNQVGDDIYFLFLIKDFRNEKICKKEKPGSPIKLGMTITFNS
jgi:hypothetical protein